MALVHDAAEEGDLEAVRRHLDSGVSVDLQDEDGSTALMMAVVEDNKEVAALLLERGANVDLQDKDGRTALMKAVDGNNKEMAALLLAHGASTDIGKASSEKKQVLLAVAAALDVDALGTMVAGLALSLIHI